MWLFAVACVSAPPPAQDSTVERIDTAAPVDTDTAVDTGGAASKPRAVLGGIPMVRVSAGTFWMGSPETEAGRSDSEQQHEVTLSRDFYIGETPITRGQYRELMGMIPDESDPCDDECAVRRVRWHDAAALANAVSAAEGLEACFECSGDPVMCTPVGNPYACTGVRLPTEAEWEYAARAGHQGPFQAGGELAADDVENCDSDVVLSDGTVLGDVAWYCGSSGMWVQPVGQLAANGWGLYDVSGNVYEWLYDWAGADHGSGPVTDPTGPETGQEKHHRGGSWGSFPKNARLSARTFNTPDVGQTGSGVRLVWTAP